MNIAKDFCWMLWLLKLYFIHNFYDILLSCYFCRKIILWSKDPFLRFDAAVFGNNWTGVANTLCNFGNLIYFRKWLSNPVRKLSHSRVERSSTEASKSTAGKKSLQPKVLPFNFFEIAYVHFNVFWYLTLYLCFFLIAKLLLFLEWES